MFDQGQFYPGQPIQFMEGLLTPVMGSGAASVNPVSFLTSAVSTVATITVPGTILAGDIAFLVDAIVDSTLTPVYPAGWTTIDEVAVTGAGGSSTRMICSYKILVSGDAGATVTGMASPNPARKSMLVFRGSAPITACAIAGIISSTTGNVAGQPVNVAITAGSGSVPSVSIASWRCSTTITTRGFSPAEDAEIANGTTMYTKYKTYNASPSDITLSMVGGTGTKIQEGFYAVLS